MIETATAAPGNQKTIETVVDVGIPKVLKRSSRITSVIITARKMIIISLKKNMSGWKIPLRATSIMPFEKVAPTITPRLAIKNMAHLGAAFEPIAELRKCTASLLTPTIRSEIASANNTTTRIM